MHCISFIRPRASMPKSGLSLPAQYMVTFSHLASPYSSALPSPQQTAIASTALRTRLQSVYQSPTAFPPTCEQSPEILELHHIPNTSHLAGNHRSTSSRSLTDDVIRITSFTKSRCRILRPPILTTCATWPHLGILSIKNMKRTNDKGQP